MAMTERLKEYLEDESIPYRTEPHAESATARQVAAAAHVPGQRVAKVVVARDLEGDYVMAVIPANRHLDFGALAEASGRYRLNLASEPEVTRLFPDCEVGAMPPFGNLYGLPVYVDACFPHDAELVFQPGNHHEVTAVDFEDYDRHVKPVIGEFCTH